MNRKLTRLRAAAFDRQGSAAVSANSGCGWMIVLRSLPRTA